MTRGGYLLIIGFLFGMFVYQQYAHERMIDRYEALIINGSLSKDSLESEKDVISAHLSELKVSFDKLYEQSKLTPEKQDTIIIHNHITRVVLPANEKIEVKSDYNVEDYLTPINTEDHALEITYRESS